MTGPLNATGTLSVVDGYDAWAATYDTGPNLTRDAAAAKVRVWATALRGASVLELGCGTGSNTEVICEVASSVTALDISAGMLARAEERLQGRAIQFIRHDLTKPLPCADAAFDVVVETLVLEHVSDLRPLFSEAFRVLAPGGLFLTAELHPYRQSLGKQARFRIGDEGDETLIEAYRHTVSEFTNVAIEVGFEVFRLEEDEGPPGELRLFSMRLKRPAR